MLCCHGRNLVSLVLQTLALGGCVVHMLVAPRESPWVVCVAADCDLNWILLKHATASGGCALTQHASAGHDLCNRSKALFHSLILVVLHIDFDWSITLTETLGRCFIIIVTLSRVELDGVVPGLAGAHIELALRVEGLLRSWTLGTTNWINLVTDGLLWTVLGFLCLRVDASLEASAALPHVFLCWLTGLKVHWKLITGPVLLTNTTLATGEETHTKGGPLVKDWLSSLGVGDGMRVMV